MVRLAIAFAIVAIAATPTWAISVRTVYSIYFPTNRADIVGDNRKVIEEAADRIRKSPNLLRVEVSGHADRVGPRWYNHRLSENRAIVVRNMLVALGVPVRLVRLQAGGEDGLLVPTADDVAEPENRRVEIRLIFKK